MINLIILLLPSNALHSSFCQVSIVELSMARSIGEESTMSRNVTRRFDYGVPAATADSAQQDCLV